MQAPKGLPMSKFILLLLLSLVPLVSVAQTADSEDLRRYRNVRDSVTSGTQWEIHSYVSKLDSGHATAQEIRDHLDRIFSEDKRNFSKAIGPSLALVEDLPVGRLLVTGYVFVRGLHEPVSTIAGYRSINGRFQLVASTGADFDGHGLFTAQLPSQVPGEVWILAWGPAFTFNGTKIRMRMIAFDGTQFRDLWTPDDMLNAKVSISAQGAITIEHRDPERYYIRRQPPFTLRDEYILRPTGPIRISSSYVPE